MTPAAAAEAILERALSPNVLAQACPSRTILTHVANRWGLLVLLALYTGGTLRFAQLRRKIGGISERMLSQTLQQLEGDGLVHRHAHDVVPPHVDYKLTEPGHELATRVADLTTWIETNLARLPPGKV